MVCVLSELHNELLHQVPFDFMPENDASKLFKPWNGTKESKMLADYDPNTEVVICFLRKGGDDKTEIDSYKLITNPKPPLAAEQDD